jgi:hypothetical protein
MTGLDALIALLSTWNGGVSVFSHEEGFITAVAKNVSARKLLFLCCWLRLSSYRCALIMQ